MKLLERIGELTGRPGLSAYCAVMRVGAPKEELHAWATGNGADPLVGTVWDRIKLIEGEGAADRIAREQTEARATGERRRAQAERSRRLIRERGLRDPKTERLRFLGLVGAVALIALISLGAIAYFVDAQGRERTLANNANDIPAVRTFLAQNAWHPVAAQARDKLARLDIQAWNAAHDAGTIDALTHYVHDATGDPQGGFLTQAQTQLATAQQTKRAQEILARLLLYRGPIDGAANADTRAAVELFRYRWNMQVSDVIDTELMQRLVQALNIWIYPQIDDLRAVTLAHPTKADYVRIANTYGVDGAGFLAVAEVETGGLGGWGPDGRMIILFERHLFSRRTNHQYDASHPNISSSNFGGYPPTQQARWAQLAEAFALDPEAAFQSASYGKSQILGQNYRLFGFETAGEFVRFLSQSEGNQLEFDPALCARERTDRRTATPRLGQLRKGLQRAGLRGQSLRSEACRGLPAHQHGNRRGK